MKDQRLNLLKPLQGTEQTEIQELARQARASGAQAPLVIQFLAVYVSSPLPEDITGAKQVAEAWGFKVDRPLVYEHSVAFRQVGPVDYVHVTFLLPLLADGGEALLGWLKGTRPGISPEVERRQIDRAKRYYAETSANRLSGRPDEIRESLDQISSPPPEGEVEGVVARILDMRDAASDLKSAQDALQQWNYRQGAAQRAIRDYAEQRKKGGAPKWTENPSYPGIKLKPAAPPSSEDLDKYIRREESTIVRAAIARSAWNTEIRLRSKLLKDLQTPRPQTAPQKSRRG